MIKLLPILLILTGCLIEPETGADVENDKPADVNTVIDNTHVSILTKINN